MSRITAAQIAIRLEAKTQGDEQAVADRCADLAKSGPGALSFARQHEQVHAWLQGDGSVLMTTRKSIRQLLESGALNGEASGQPDQNGSTPQRSPLEPGKGRCLVVVKDPDGAMAQIGPLLAPPMARPIPGISPAAHVSPDAELGHDVCIGPGAVVGTGAKLGDRTVLQPGAMVLEGAIIGADCMIWPGVMIREGCVIGDRCIFHANAVIGADGFGYRPSPSTPDRPTTKVPQIGGVRIGDDVEIGANSCVDRATLGVTVIEDFVKIDNLCQIGHNSRIGRGTIICGMSGVAGSCDIGSFVLIGGGCGVPDHVTIGDRASLAARTSPIGDLAGGESYGGIPALPARAWRRQLVAIRDLPDLVKAMRQR